MKRLLAILLVLLVTATAAQVPMNWSVDEVNIGQDITLSADEELFTEGVRSCHMQLNSGAVPYLVSDRFAVIAGSAYTFSIDALDSDTTGQIKVYADFFNEVGNMVFGEDPEFSGNSAEWQTIQWQGIIPPGAVEGYVLIKFYCEPELTKFVDTAHAWVDNCIFLDKDGINLFLGGGFEQWVVGVEEPVIAASSLTIFPNPTDGPVTVRTTENADLVRIYDLSGRMLMEEPMAGRSEIILDLRGLTGGFYTVSLLKSHSLVASTKLILR
jgi:hypothetical protein